MPYSHYHGGAYHTHRRRSRFGRHYGQHRLSGYRGRGLSRLFYVIVIMGVAWIALSLYEQQPAAINRGLPQRTAAMLGAWTQALFAGNPESADEEDRRNQHERTIAMLTNIERGNDGKPPLAWDKKLQQIARTHSQDMAEHDYFSHVDQDGGKATDRGLKAGYRCRKQLTARQFQEGLGENIYFGSRGYMEPEDAVESWMNSPGHRANMLASYYDRIGIGVHKGHHTGYGDGYFTTMVLC